MKKINKINIKDLIKNKKLLIILLAVIVIITAVVILLLNKETVAKENYEYLYYSYETSTGDHYYNKARLNNGIVDIVYVTVTYKASNEEEVKKIADYEYKLLSANSEKYQDVVINKDNTISYTALKDKSYNKTKEEIEKSYTKSKIHFNFKWEE